MADVRTQQARERVALALTWAPHRPGEGGFADGIAALDELADLVAALETALRYELWVNHGCGFAALYGDDGEMSCGMCGWDFKRSDVLDTIEYVKGARLKRAAALAGAAAEPECEHRNIHFDRSLCACGAMHNYCDDCGMPLDDCD